jgi:hypothetical protein
MEKKEHIPKHDDLGYREDHHALFICRRVRSLMNDAEYRSGIDQA